MMNRISENQIREWILDYCVHDVAEQKEVRDFVNLHLEWREVYETAIRWERLLGEAKSIANPDLDETVLPYAVATDGMTDNERDPFLRSAIDRILRRADSKENLSELLYSLESRKAEAALSTNAVDHFEFVTGHSRMVSSHTGVKPTLYRQNNRIGRSFRRRGNSNSHDFARTWPFRSSTVRRGLVRASFAFAGVYLLLFLASTYRDSPIERMAHLRSPDLTWTELGVSARGDETEWGLLLRQQYEEALSIASGSKKTFLGLFPTYRFGELRRARNLLRNTINTQKTRETVPMVAFVTMAKIHFLLGDETKSLDALREGILQMNQRASRGRAATGVPADS